MSISAQGSNFAGESLNLTCTAVEEDDVMGTPTLTWLGLQGEIIQSGGAILVGNMVTVGRTTSVSLQFNPLMLSHSGNYSCRAEITELSFSSIAAYQVTVTGKLKYILLLFESH